MQFLWQRAKCNQVTTATKHMRKWLPEYLFNLFHLVVSFKIPGIKYILEQICQKWKYESIQSASRRLKVCLTLFISVVIIRTAIMHCLHTICI